MHYKLKQLQDQIDMDNIKYCVNHKGQKIKPYGLPLKYRTEKVGILRRIFNCIFNRSK